MPGCSISSVTPTAQATAYTVRVASSVTFEKPERAAGATVSSASCKQTASSQYVAIKSLGPLLAAPQSSLRTGYSARSPSMPPTKVWVTDITYIRPWQGWLYLAVVVDLFARKVVGWSMKPSLSKELALDALLMAVWRRKLAGRVAVHSDQGSQYGSDDFKRFCQAHNLEPSMSRRANCWDNAVAESFFSSLKKERIRKRIYKTRDLARADMTCH
jgi:putative transposase